MNFLKIESESLNVNEFEFEKVNLKVYIYIYLCICLKVRNFGGKQPCIIQNRKKGPQNVHGIRAAKINICRAQHGEEHTLCLRVALDDAQGQKIHFDLLTCTV